MRFLTAILLSLVMLPGLAWSADGGVKKFYGVERDVTGSWWFRSPTGERFLSLGVSAVSRGPSPNKYDPANPAYAAFRHYESHEAWAQDVRSKMQRWGFNTVGAWGDPLLVAPNFPECRALHWGKQLRVPWCDLFADEFERRIEAFALADVAPHRNAPHLLGWFTDNEIEWYADTIFWFHLHHAEETATRRELVGMLKEFYEDDFDALQRDFDVGAARGFNEVGLVGPAYLKPHGKGYAVVNQFAFLVAKQYYRVVHDAIRRHDPNHLILGDRYMSYCPRAVVRAAGPYVDVISTNFDWPDWKQGELPTHYLQMLHAESGKPVLVTEWYVAAMQNRSGNRNSLDVFTKVETQSERAATSASRIETMVSKPYIVGAHWFCYADEPPNGRPIDGEDFNFGLVDIHNQPYEELTSAMQRAHARARQLHADDSRPDKRKQLAVGRNEGGDFPECLEWFTAVATDDPAPLADLRVAWDEENLYVGLVGFQWVERRLLEGGKIPSPLRRQLTVKVGSSSFDLCVQPDDDNVEEMKLAQVATRHLHDGVRFTYLAKIPSKRIANIDQFRAGKSIMVEAVLRDSVDGATTWKTEAALRSKTYAATSVGESSQSAADRGSPNR